MSYLTSLSDADLLALHQQVQQAPRQTDPFMTRFAREALLPAVVAPAQIMSRPLSWAGSGIESLAGQNPVSDYLKATPAAADAQAQQMRAAEQQGAPEGIDWAAIAGNTAATLPLGGLKLGGALLSRLAQGAAVGAASENTSDLPAGVSTAVGAGISGALPPVVRATGAALAGKISPAVQSLKDLGVQLTPGQILGGGALRMEQGATSIPVTGDFIRNRQAESFASLNKGVANYVLAPVGENVADGVKAGNDTVSHVAEKLGGLYDSILSKGSLDPGPNILPNLQSIVGQAQAMMRPQDADKLRVILQNEVVNAIKPGQMMTGDMYKGIDSKLRKIITDYRGQGDYFAHDLGDRLEDVKNYLRMEFDAQNPEVAQKLVPVDAAWARFKRMESAAGAIGSGKNDGVFTPDQLLSATRRLDPSLNKAQFARGDALMQELAQHASSVMGNKVPDSGTAYRSALKTGGALLAAALGGHEIPFVGPAAALAAAGVGLGSLPYTQTGTKLLAKVLTQRPDALRALGGGFKRSATTAGKLGAPAGVALANALAQSGPQ